jgi:hypothetical protein
MVKAFSLFFVLVFGTTLFTFNFHLETGISPMYCPGMNILSVVMDAVDVLYNGRMSVSE